MKDQEKRQAMRLAINMLKSCDISHEEYLQRKKEIHDYLFLNEKDKPKKDPGEFEISVYGKPVGEFEPLQVEILPKGIFI